MPTLTKNKQRLENQRGAALVVTSLIILTILTLVFLGVSTSLTEELKMFESLQNSPPSYYAADSGAERVLYKLNKQGYSPLPPYPLEVLTFTLENGGSYKVIATSSTTFKSIGEMDDISRSVELSY